MKCTMYKNKYKYEIYILTVNKVLLLKKGITNVIDEICCKEGEKMTCKYSS